jgi:hypothetical protein
VVGTITLKESLRKLDAGEICDLMVISADFKKKKAGKELHLDQVKKHIHLTYAMQKQLQKDQQRRSFARNPHHYDNSTRNVISPNGDITTIHIRLIRRFNQKTVL